MPKLARGPALEFLPGPRQNHGVLALTPGSSALPDTPPPKNLSRQLLPKFYRWSDAISPLVLLRCIQPAFSLTIMATACAAYWATVAVHDQLDDFLPVPVSVQPADSGAVQPADSGAALVSLELPWLETQAFGQAVRYSLSPAVILGLGVENPEVWNRLLKQIVMYLLWLVPVGLVLRASITSCAQRRETSWPDTLRLLRQRGLAMASVVLIPLLAVAFAAAVYWVLGYLSRLSAVTADVLMLVCLPLLIAAGVLAVGSLFAVPLAWASLLTEKDCDPFDALSRGYEYTLRRLIPLAIYVLAAWAIHWVAFRLIEAVCRAGWNIAERLFIVASQGRPLPGITHGFVLHLPQVFSVILLWALIGGIYLLLRHDANEQEIEDIEENLLTDSP